MTAAIELREFRTGDLEALERLHSAAFPDEDLVSLVRELSGDASCALSLLAEVEGRVVGHVMFTDCGGPGGGRVSLLGPLAVAPELQRQGVGSRLVRDGLARIEGEGSSAVFVLGDPNYYGRFGFRPELEVEPPYSLPAEWAGAWQSLHWMRGAERSMHRLVVPAPWKHRALWSS